MADQMTIALLLFAPAMALDSIDEMSAYGLDNHTSASGGCGTGASNLQYAAAQASRVKLKFDLWVTSSLWDDTAIFLNAAVDVEDFSQEQIDTGDPFPVWGADDLGSLGADVADVVYLSSHGAVKCVNDDGPLVWFRLNMGQDNQGTDCRVYSSENGATGSYGHHFRRTLSDLD